MMPLCNGCGGVIGRDCFNPSECEYISRQMDIDDAVRKEQDRHYRQQEKEYYEWLEKRHNNYPGAWYQPLFNYLCDQHGVVLTESEMGNIINIVNTMQATPQREGGQDETTRND